MQDDNPDNFTINLFRLTDDVRSEILRAIDFYKLYNLAHNRVLVQRAINDIRNIYSTLKGGPGINETPINEATPTPQEALTNINIENSIKAFEQYLAQSIEKSNPSTKPLLEKLALTYNQIVVQNLK